MRKDLTNRWVRRKQCKVYDEYWLKNFLSCSRDFLLKNFELMPIGFNPYKQSNYYFY